jgi:hypothetical protein
MTSGFNQGSAKILIAPSDISEVSRGNLDVSGKIRGNDSTIHERCNPDLYFLGINSSST